MGCSRIDRQDAGIPAQGWLSILYCWARDITPPTAVCKTTIINADLNINGTVTVLPSAINNGSSDNCSVWSYSLIAKLYTSANLGNNNLTITVKDYKGNVATCISVVTVLPYDGNNLIDNSGNDDQEMELMNPEAFDFAVYPNSTSGAVNVAMEIKRDETIFIRIFDLNGRLIYLQETEGFEGENVFRLHLDELKSGVYLMDVQVGEFKAVKRMLKQD